VVSLLDTLLAAGRPVGAELDWVSVLPGVVSGLADAVGEVVDT
jgi:hypothetical protein